MKYCEIWIAALIAKTTTLTQAEFGAYVLMLLHCYGNECPLPFDEDELRAICRCRKAGDFEPVRKVLDRYWFKGADGWHNERVDEELAKAQQRIHKARLGAAARWGHDAPSIAQASPEHASEHMPEQCSSICPDDAPHTTYHTRQSTDHIPQEEHTRAAAPHPSAIEDKGNGQTGDALELLQFLNERTGKHFQPVPANVNLIQARLAEGASIDDCRAMIAIRVREWGKDNRMAKYLRPKTLFDSSNFANYIGEVGRNEP